VSLTIEQILAAKDAKVEEVPVPEWGGAVFVRRLSANAAIEFYLSLRGIQGTEAEIGKARLVASLAAFLCDADARPIATLEQAKIIAEKSAGVVDRIVTRGHRINATDDREIDARAKNSEPSPADSSLSN
jgi:hypothetical protein